MSHPRAQAAFHWIIDILEKTRTPFQITGGLAANVYGSERELADIDIDIPEDHLGSLVPLVIDFIVFGPQQFKSENWDLLLMRLDYQGQEIDLGGAFQPFLIDYKRKLGREVDLLDIASLEQKSD